MLISTHVGEEQFWLSLGLKSKMFFVFPPGIFHQFRKFSNSSRYTLSVLSDGLLLYLLFGAHLFFALGQGGVSRRDSGPKLIKQF